MKNQWNLILSSFFCLAIVLVISSTAGNKQSLPTEPEEGKWLPITENVKGTLTDVEGIPLLTLWGSNYEQGYAHGYLYAPEIMEYLEKQLQSQEGTVEFIEAVVLPYIDKYTVPEEYLHEMEGFLVGMEARAGGAVYVSAVDRNLTLNDVIAWACVDNPAHLLSQY